METTATTRISASEAVLAAVAAVRALDLPPAALPLRDAALEVAEIVRKLDADDEIVIAALLRPLLAAKLLDREGAEKRFGAAPARLARELNELGEFGLSPDWTPESGLDAGQAEALRKMLLAVVADVRLVVIRLAEQLQKMRSAKSLGASLQRMLALDTREVYAPLANRLGVWQVKWELEDLAFRYLHADEYRHIATALKTRRAEREMYIEELTRRLQVELQRAGIAARIDGRPKHIFSIWRKMQSKHLAFEQLMDVRAARILVNTVADCYAALGVVHALWQFIPREFDDYIATPKDNLYRSIHTAVIGPGDQPVEIQIRTHAMHADAERGVAAHWRYKEGGRADQAYERKINQLRSLLAPAADGGGEPDFLDRVRTDLFQDRVYALSPRGSVVEVPVGGTPLDFAYQLHTDLGHRTRGAKVNGRIVPLDYRLKNGETVEIITGKSAAPSRDWLSAKSGFLASPRHRRKVGAWFRKRSPIEQPVPGIRPTPGAHPSRPSPAREPGNEVQGIGELLSTYARCCNPAPGEPIVGYITVGRGVRIHAESCRTFARMAVRSPARVLATAWGVPTS